MNRCTVFPAAAASDGSSILGTFRDANGQRWRAGLAPAPPSTEATNAASTARTGGQMGESVDRNERGRRFGGVEQGFRGGGLYVRTGLTGVQRRSKWRHASPVEWPATAGHVNDFCQDAILARHRWRGVEQSWLASRSGLPHRDPPRRHCAARRDKRPPRGVIRGAPESGGARRR